MAWNRFNGSSNACKCTYSRTEVSQLLYFMGASLTDGKIMGMKS